MSSADMKKNNWQEIVNSWKLIAATVLITFMLITIITTGLSKIFLEPIVEDSIAATLESRGMEFYSLGSGVTLEGNIMTLNATTRDIYEKVDSLNVQMRIMATNIEWIKWELEQ